MKTIQKEKQNNINIYKCCNEKCKQQWTEPTEKEPLYTSCKKCGSIYFIWLNYEERVNSNNTNNEYKI